MGYNKVLIEAITSLFQIVVPLLFLYGIATPKIVFAFSFQLEFLLSLVKLAFAFWFAKMFGIS